MSLIQNEIVTIALDDIYVDETQNVRKNYDEKSMKELISSIKGKGLIQPLTVRASETGEETGGKRWVLTAGFRRYRALRELKYDRSGCTVVAVDRKGGAIINMVENVNREGLTSYEMARGFCMLRDEHGMTAEEISKTIKGEGLSGKGKSASNVGNLMRAYDQVHPVIREAWETKHEKITTYLLFKLMGMDQDAQLVQWEIVLGIRDLDGNKDGENPENPGGTGGTEDPKPEKPKCRAALDVVNAIAIVRQAVKAEEIDPETGKTIVDCLKWVLKKRATIPGIKTNKSGESD